MSVCLYVRRLLAISIGDLCAPVAQPNTTTAVAGCPAFDWTPSTRASLVHVVTRRERDPPRCGRSCCGSAASSQSQQLICNIDPAADSAARSNDGHYQRRRCRLDMVGAANSRGRCGRGGRCPDGRLDHRILRD
ncbi:hypothetical protein VOLCADRAFT_99286 [Volvox carteri f. nagariensis]|uniref:Secreted protein n=1 Tax=Volvox carteri f. nagariensis TaxID=3068 RepID=D8UHF1_VOLCA|nr:uncharacterized protein VOLCADRAFT_99286 [Volvox carteri f. nagariensis]EFJ40842.1 hypothetical protein VOLCADRAFT_99286 [Volvox carteri f. nagariensis]|eukprot:XP_002958111.1 hypothetical protein VOLCADRAFT_99286 [Volvox carteri f. nagariensis]